jgi:3-oxo-5alpha-steroid 4-dehydrogenase
MVLHLWLPDDRKALIDHLVERGRAHFPDDFKDGDDTLLQLAAKLHMPVENLQRTVNDYNALSEKGAEDPFGKPAEHRAVLQQGPWYALDCRVDGAVRNPSITLGGLRVDEKTGQVLADKGGVIKGLYAAGRSAVGIASHSYVSGLSIAGCIFSGRRAGHHAGGQQKPE